MDIPKEKLLLIEWILKQDNGVEGTFSLVQRYQKVGGTLTAEGRTYPLLGATVRGDQLSFSWIDAGNNLRAARFLVADNSMRGELGWWSAGRLLATARKR